MYEICKEMKILSFKVKWNYNKELKEDISIYHEYTINKVFYKFFHLVILLN